ncbi:oxygen-independent coproporphyrinogen III oxidase [Aliiruegeria sabulilitoris]|uniref:oxygen-independent coproporphyrinogen III oxidase n=1 Tax=Aliiruegeria sabulilitoris TaxID=1510458 RepID=UPI0008376D1D|nr:oxygen-independent coproporphyrinogen III oxidase [Aliiruegeria sabulilitoris]NDR57102.1 oxygen-independent coproporphyrinogen III oxidase [Pseudoruegeria sp. M32A2M]
METVSQLAKLGLFDARVPRYTSYPTAPHFNNAVDSTHFTDWVAALPPESDVSLYIHIPFCRRLCWFCACRTQGTSSLSPVAGYLETLKAEIDLLAAALPSGVKLSALHWGGGTPTLLAPEMMTELADSVFRTIPLAEHGEFSVEIDPNEIDEARLDALAAAGMTRASIGVQDFDPEIQKIIGREQSFEVTQAAVDGIRARGVTSLNTDILYGLPNQSRARITDSVQKLLSLSPDRVALYGYAHVPWMARRQTMIPADALPTPEERLHLFETARRLFLWDGYDEIGIDHFAARDDSMAVAARDGTLRRNFQGYTVDPAPALIGLGASAISRFPQGYAQNISGTSDYTKAIREGRFATGRGHVFAGEDLIRARMIETLMCDFRIDRAEIERDFGARPDFITSLFAAAKAQFGQFVTVDARGLEIPPEGRPLTRMIAKAFDAYEMAKTGHSSAI